MLAPENQIIDHLLSDIKKEGLKSFRAEVAKLNSIDRQSTERTKNGMAAGISVIHPLTGEQVGVWFGDYVLPDYATGAVMFVPAHDERDQEFASKYNIPSLQVIKTEEGNSTGGGELINSGQFDGLDNVEAKAKITTYLESM